MAIQFRIPRLGKPNICHEYYSCECGFVTSREHSDSHVLQQAEKEIARVRFHLDKGFLNWARRLNAVTAPPLPPKLL
jgi:hypothetical protein